MSITLNTRTLPSIITLTQTQTQMHHEKLLEYTVEFPQNSMVYLSYIYTIDFDFPLMVYTFLSFCPTQWYTL